jgi:hypothetical protein
MIETDLKQYLDYYLQRLGEDQNAFFSLVEADHAILPLLAAAFREEGDSRKRSAILEVIWQHRVPGVVPILDEALHDPSSSVWKQALDGLVAIGLPECLAVLRQARDRRSETLPDAVEFQDAVDEAIGQAQHGCFREKQQPSFRPDWPTHS